jgi:DNA-directed RNA polymerase subunit RPC12/RpoP
MDVGFACQHCGKKLLADEVDIGQSVPCPACGGLIVVPSPVQSEAKPREKARKKVVMRVPAAAEATKTRASLPGKAGQTGSGRAAMTAAGQPTASEFSSAAAGLAPDSHTVEIVVGWICIIVGILIEILLPNALLAYIPFFIGAVIMGIILLCHGKVAHGLVMILCTIIPAPLLMHHNVWKGMTMRKVEPKADAGGARKLVFDGSGQPKLVSVDKPIAKRPDTRPSSKAPRPEMQSLEAWRASRKAPAQKEAGAGRPEARAPRSPPTPGVQDPYDPYKDLLEGKEEIPPLIPEEEMAKPFSSREPGFRWQEDSPEAKLLPGDPAFTAHVPFVIYSEVDGEQLFSPSGYMGNQASLTVDDNWNVDVQAGRTCIRVAYADTFDWAGLVWQHPPDNWGDMPGGYDFSKASKLTFWAKGETGKEEVEFMVGMQQSLNAMSRDSLHATTGKIRLRSKWKKHSIPLEKLDRSRLISAFAFRIEGQEKPVVFYLDDIQFE